MATSPSPPKKIHFAIFYYSADAAFERAAKTWERQIGANTSDEVILKVVLTEGTFRQAWNEIHKRVNDVLEKSRADWPDGQFRIDPVTIPKSGRPNWPSWQERPPSVTVGEGHVFSHAASGLEFKPLVIMPSASKDDSLSPEQQEQRAILRDILKATREDGTLTGDEIRELPRLPWDPQNGLLVLHGCHTGEPNPRAHTILGKIFAESQQVRTIGQRGAANFSAWRGFRKKITDGTRDVYLWAYDEPVNIPSAQQTWSGEIIRPARPGVVFLP